MVARSTRTAALALVLATLLSWCMPPAASAHAGLTNADPAIGATLGASPTSVQLTFSEQPDPGLTSIAVQDARGQPYQTGHAEAVAGDPLSLSVPVRPLPKGAYTVHFRVLSAVDGHATTGAFSFGVQVAPPQLGPSASRSTTAAVSSSLEVVARWVLLVGLLAVLGAAAAETARFGDLGGGDLLLGFGGWAMSAVGVVMLGAAQRRNAGSSLGALLSSPVGHALIWRAVAIAVAGVALLVAPRQRRRSSVRRAAFAAAGLATVAAIIVHVANGHAAASSWPSAVSVIAQSAHVAAAGIWIGGLAALLIGLRGASSATKTTAVKRFAGAAAVGLVVVVVSGILRAFSELRGWSELWSTGYGRAVLAKLALVALIAALALRNRRRSVSTMATSANLSPLRRTSAAELTLAVVAVAVAALLGTLAPPVAGQTRGLAGLAAAGTDVGNTVHVRLSTLSNQPGPNRFVARINNAHSDTSIRNAAVQLLFTPLDDPGIASSSLALTPAPDATYVGSGPNLRFDGRWAVRVLVRQGDRAVEVPLELNPLGVPQQISIQRIPGQAPEYTKEDGTLGFVRISPHPERAGPSQLYVTCYDIAIGSELPVSSLVVTMASGHGPARQQSLRRIGACGFVSDTRLRPGRNEIAVIAHTRVNTRLRSVFDLDVPGG